MNIDEPGEEQVIDEDFLGGFDENLFQDLLADDILDPDLNINNPNIEGGGQGAGQQCPQRMVVVDPLQNLPKFSGEKTESVDNHLDVFGDYLEITQINVIWVFSGTEQNFSVERQAFASFQTWILRSEENVYLNNFIYTCKCISKYVS